MVGERKLDGALFGQSLGGADEQVALVETPLLERRLEGGERGGRARDDDRPARLGVESMQDAGVPRRVPDVAVRPRRERAPGSARGARSPASRSRPGRIGAVGWPAGLSTTTKSAVSRTTFSGASGEASAGASTTWATSMRSASPPATLPPLGRRRPLTRTAPSSMARFTRARLSSGTSCAMALSSRAPSSDSGTTSSRTSCALVGAEAWLCSAAPPMSSPVTSWLPFRFKAGHHWYHGGTCCAPRAHMVLVRDRG